MCVIIRNYKYSYFVNVDFFDWHISRISHHGNMRYSSREGKWASMKTVHQIPWQDRMSGSKDIWWSCFALRFKFTNTAIVSVTPIGKSRKYRKRMFWIYDVYSSESQDFFLLNSADIYYILKKKTTKNYFIHNVFTHISSNLVNA